jgi:Domain of Unknown Function (DUF1080)
MTLRSLFALPLLALALALAAPLPGLAADGEWTPLFNGKDLSGWKGLVANPVKRAQMTPEQLAAEQVKAEENVKKHWRVENGEIVTTGHGNNLCTVEPYGDFEFEVEWKIQPNGDSGIYLRGTPQVQIWDPTNEKEIKNGGDKGSGALWNNKKEGRFPLVKADKPAGEWNHFWIRMVGDKVTIKLNGQLTVDNATMENYWNPSAPIFPREQLELQAHGNEVRFRNIKVKKLN